MNDYGADPSAPPTGIFACHADFFYRIPAHFDLTCGQHIGIGSENALHVTQNTRLCAIDFPSKLLFLAVKGISIIGFLSSKDGANLRSCLVIPKVSCQ